MKGENNMIYLHYNTETGEIIKAYHHSCKNIPQPNIEVTDDVWYDAVNSGKLRAIKDGTLVLTEKPVIITIEDYDRVMEKHIKQTRIARGYTTREPDCYINSSNPRWRQDAIDFIAFRDSVMEYGLNIINNYKQTGSAPTLVEFEAGLPIITWSEEQ